MANGEHIKFLEQGVDVWNKWRKENPDIFPDLKGMCIAGSALFGANLNRTDLNGAKFIHCNLSSDKPTYLDLGGSTAFGVQIAPVDLSGANLSKAELEWVDLSNANLSDAVISKTILTDANLNGANFNSAHIGFVTFGNNDLSQVKGLNTVKHFGPSNIDIGTIYHSKGNIPEMFLRGTGIPDSFIAYMATLTEKALRFYSCFISFAESDEAFSEKLYSDLLATGVRCWRWKEDAQWGKALLRSIDEAIHLHDELIIICSEDSLNSPAVLREIERALQKEDQLARQGNESEVLFPVRLDDYIFDEWSHHRKADVTSKNVGDFRQWKDPELYQKALRRLMRDLETE